MKYLGAISDAKDLVNKGYVDGLTGVGYTTSGNNYAVQRDSNGNLYVAQTVVTAGSSTTNGGLMSQADKTKLNGIATGAEVNTISTIKMNSTALTPDSNKAVNITVPTSASDVSAVATSDKYTRTSAGGLDWSNQTDGDAKVIAKSALAFWDGTYNGTGSNLSKCAAGTILGTNTVADYIIEKGTTSSWYYRKWNSGKIEAWRTQNMGSQTPTQWVTGWYYKDVNITIPNTIFSSTPNNVLVTNKGSDYQFMVFSAVPTSATNITVRVVKPNSGAATPNLSVYVSNMT